MKICFLAVLLFGFLCYTARILKLKAVCHKQPV